MKKTPEEILIETTDAILDCQECDGDTVVGMDVAGIKAVLIGFHHRYHNGSSPVEDAVIEKLKDRYALGEFRDLNESWMSKRDITEAQQIDLDSALRLEECLAK